MTAATPGQAERILPAYDAVGERELSEAVHQALGAASVCWEPMDCTGVFESSRAAQIGAELMSIVGQYADDSATPAEPQPAPEMGTGSAPSDVRPRADGRRGLDITCGSCGEDYGTNVPDMDEIECPECEARRCPHCLTWYGGRS